MQMIRLHTPMRWPGAWREPSALDLLRGTAIDCVLVPQGSEFDTVRSRARAAGLLALDAQSPPPGIRIVKGEWPGVKMGRNSRAEAGPTGVPWVDSNGWAIRLERIEHPDAEVWVDAAPAANAAIPADAYMIAIADGAANGGRWIIALDDALAAAVLARKPEADRPWNRIKQAAAFFAAHPDWPEYLPVAAIGVVSDFSGGNEFFSRELLNLLARAGQPACPIAKDRVDPGGLKALVYTDAEPPSADLRRRVMDFVAAGGLLIAAAWPAPPGQPAACPLDGFTMSSHGKGRVALAKEPPQDPYALAADCVLLLSHRHDLVRVWNGGATAFSFTQSPDGKRALVQVLFFSYVGPDAASVWVRGRFRTAAASTIDAPRVDGIEMVEAMDGTEVHLPRISQYVALELGV